MRQCFLCQTYFGYAVYVKFSKHINFDNHKRIVFYCCVVNYEVDYVIVSPPQAGTCNPIVSLVISDGNDNKMVLEIPTDIVGE